MLKICSSNLQHALIPTMSMVKRKQRRGGVRGGGGGGPSLAGSMPVGPAECMAAEDMEGSTASVSACPACAMPAALVSVGPSTLPSAFPLPSAWPSPSAFPSPSGPLLDGEEGGLGMGAARVSVMGAPACSASPLGSLMRSAKALSRACPRDSPAAPVRDLARQLACC